LDGGLYTSLVQELIEVVTGNPARDLRIAIADERRIPIAEPFERRVDLTAAAPIGDDAFEFVLARLTDPQPQTLVRQDLELLDVVDRIAAHHGVNAARVVPDHPAERAVRVRRGVRREGQMVLLGGFAQSVQHESRLDARVTRFGIKFDQATHVFRVVEDDRHIAALPGEACAAATAATTSSASRGRTTPIGTCR
jgi:hypothetical protein